MYKENSVLMRTKNFFTETKRFLKKNVHYEDKISNTILLNLMKTSIIIVIVIQFISIIYSQIIDVCSQCVGFYEEIMRRL